MLGILPSQGIKNGTIIGLLKKREKNLTNVQESDMLFILQKYTTFCLHLSITQLILCYILFFYFSCYKLKQVR